MKSRKSTTQGLTLIHLSAQRKHVSWGRGCLGGIYRAGGGSGSVEGVVGGRLNFGCVYGVFQVYFQSRKRLRLSRKVDECKPPPPHPVRPGSVRPGRVVAALAEFQSNVGKRLMFFSFPVETRHGQSEVNPGSSRGQYGVDMMSIRGQYGVNLGSKLGQSGVNLGSIYCQSMVNLGSIWGQSAVNLRLI